MASVTRIPPPRTRFMPRDPRVEGPYRMTPQIALRLGVLGAVVLFAFAVLFFRLWALQVLSGERYLAAAQNNQLRTLRIEAPRGQIYDYRGRLIVGNQLAQVVRIWPASVPRRAPPRPAARPPPPRPRPARGWCAAGAARARERGEPAPTSSVGHWTLLIL